MAILQVVKTFAIKFGPGKTADDGWYNVVNNNQSQRSRLPSKQGNLSSINYTNSHAVGMTAPRPYGFKIVFKNQPISQSASRYLVIILKADFHKYNH